jgi:hypothetical protein
VAWPGYPDSFDPGWWRVNIITPPYFPGTGTLTNTSAAVTNFSATWRMQAITPLAGQQISGTGIPVGTQIAASPAPTMSGFTMTQPATASGSGVSLTIGAEPLTLAEAKQWARIENTSDDNLVQKMLAKARRYTEGALLRRALILQSRCVYFMGFPWTGGYYNRLIRSMGPNPWWLPTAQGIILLPYPPLQQVTAIKYLDPASGSLLTIDPSLYIDNTLSTPGRVMPQYGTVWPLARPMIDAVQITFNCGYGPLESDVPEDVQCGIGAIIAADYENREALSDTPMQRFPGFDWSMASEEWGSYV